jgi:hypothetical protein
MRSCLILLALTLLGIQAHAQWDIEESHTTASLRGIHNVGGGVAWASGTNGTVLRTEDGGYLWQTCAMPPGAEKLDFRGVQAFDENTAIVMSSGPGDQSRLYKTTDGCQTWKLVFTNPDKDGFWDAIDFVGSQNDHHAGKGLLIGDPVGGAFPIFESSDQGSSWTRWTGGDFNPATDPKVKQATAAKGENIFAASNESVAQWSQSQFIFVTGGSSGAKLHYADITGLCQELGGRCTLKFERIELPQLGAGPSSGAFAIASKDGQSYFPLRLMVVGGDYQRPSESRGTSVFLSSRDGLHVPLTSYFDITTPQTPPHGYRSSVAYDAAQKLWITVGPNGTDISTDDGKNWRPLPPSGYDPADADKNWNALSLPFVVGPHGRIGKLRNITQNSPAAPTTTAPTHPPTTP